MISASPEFETPGLFRDALEALLGMQLSGGRHEDEQMATPRWARLPTPVLEWIARHNSRFSNDSDAHKRIYPDARAAMKSISAATARQATRLGLTCEL